MRRKLAVISLSVAFCLAVVVTRAIWEGNSELGAGDRAQARGDAAAAVSAWRRAARWYVPGAPHVSRAYDRLQALAEVAEGRGDSELALAAWRAIRGSILATRSFYTPHSERLGPANDRIAALMARAEGSAADPGRSESERASWHRELLARDDSPSIAWSIVALIGFGLWIGGGFHFARRAITADDKLVGRQAAWSGVLIAVGLVVWLLGLSIA